jgi:hypothetical protein
LLTDYALLRPEQRNIQRLMFSDARARAVQEDWRSVARFVVASFRADAARAGAGEEAARLVDELSRTSPEFAALWRDNDVAGHAEGTKRLRHPEIGPIELELSVFGVDGRPDLAMIVYNPATGDVADRIRSLIAARSAARG